MIRWRSLSDRREFALIYRTGAKFVGRLLVLYLLPAADNAKAVVASRRLGGAVQRNRAKRLLRAALMESELARFAGAAVLRERLVQSGEGDDGDGTDGSGLWVVAVARSRILTVKTPAVVAEIARLLAGP